jgi:predicted TIM-barrel fold metal-dependent hydrolase
MSAADGGFPWLNSQQALATWSAANESGLVIDLMTTTPGNSPAAIEQFLKLAQAYPRVRMVLDHVAWPNAEGPSDFGLDAPHRSLAVHKNIYYKFTTINLDRLEAAKIDAPDMLRHVVDVFGPDQVLWGSDIGNSAGTYQEMVSRIVAASARLSDSEKRRVLHDTGKSVFVRGGHPA